MGVHGFKQVERVAHVVAKIEERAFHRFADLGMRGKMHDGIWPVFLKAVSKQLAVAEVSFDKSSPRVDGFAVSHVKVVIYDRVVPCLDDAFGGDAANVTSASSNENF